MRTIRDTLHEKRKTTENHKGGMMEQVHQTILSSLDFDSRGTLLEVGCGFGALAIRAALTWPEAKITGLDYWGAMHSQAAVTAFPGAGAASRTDSTQSARTVP